MLPAVAFGMCVMMGLVVWNRYRARRAFFASALAFCDHLAIEISFSRDTLGNIISRYGDTYMKHFRTMLFAYQKILDEKGDVTRERIVEISWHNLRPTETSVITDLFYDLGRHGASEEGKKIATKRQTIDTFFNEAAAKFKRDASIYLKLFILMGIGAVILLL